MNKSQLVELRSAVRFPLHLPVSVKADQQRHQAETSDVSAAGVLFYLDANLSVGSPIEFSLALPPEMFGLDQPVQVNCFGRVARAFNDDGRHAIAAIIDEYRFERA